MGIRHMSMLTRRSLTPARILTGAALLGAILITSACGTSSSSTTPAAAPSTSSTTQPTGTSQMLPPIIVIPGQTDASVPVGRYIVFNVSDPAHTQVSTDKPDVLELSQGHDDGSAVFNPGAKALAEGTAIVTITESSGTTSTVTVHVTA
jgi:hypothetical protein